MAMQRGVAAAMQYLSSFGFVHRALSAHSVLVNSHLECKVAHLGRSPQVRAQPRGPGLSGAGEGVAGGQAGTKGGGCLRWQTLESEGAELTWVVERTPGEGAQRDVRNGLRTLRERGESS